MIALPERVKVRATDAHDFRDWRRMTPAIDWNRELGDQLEFAWDVQFLPRLAGLTDAEYLWEPVPDCWSV